MLHEAGLGPHGVPMRLATDPDMDGWFEVEERTDYAQAVLDDWRASQKDPRPGVLPVVVNTRPAGHSPSRSAQLRPVSGPRAVGVTPASEQ